MRTAIAVALICGSRATAAEPNAPATQPYLSANLATDALIAVLNEPAWGNRTVELYRKRQACERLTADTPDVRRAIPALIHLLHDKPAAPPAAAALGRLGPMAADELLSAVRDDDATCRKYAVAALSTLPLATAGPALEDVNRHDPDAEVARNAAYALCDLRSPAAGPAIVALLHTRNRAVQLETLHAIVKWPLTFDAARGVADLVTYTDPEVSERAAGILIHDHPPYQAVVISLASVAGHAEGLPGESAAMQVLLTYPLSTFGGVDLALRVASSPYGQSQSIAIQMLRNAKPEDLGPYLYNLACLSENRSISVQRGNLKAVYEKGCSDYAADGPVDGPAAERTLTALTNILDKAELSSESKNAALRPLARFGARARRVIPAVAGILAGNSYGGDRVAAAEFLTTVAPAGAVADTAAIRAIGGRAADVRLAAERYLLAEPMIAVQLLPQLVGDSSADVRAVGLDLAAKLPAGDADLTRRVSALTADPNGDLRLTAWSLLNTWTHGPAASAVLPILAAHPPAVAVAQNDANAQLRAEAKAVATACGIDLSPPPPVAPSSAAPVGGRAEAGTSIRLVGVALLVVLLVVIVAAVLISLVIHRSGRAFAQLDMSNALAQPPMTPLESANLRNCTRCRAVIPTSSRYCRRCGLDNPTEESATVLHV